MLADPALTFTNWERLFDLADTEYKWVGTEVSVVSSVKKLFGKKKKLAEAEGAGDADTTGDKGDGSGASGAESTVKVQASLAAVLRDGAASHVLAEVIIAQMIADSQSGAIAAVVATGLCPAALGGATTLGTAVAARTGVSVQAALMLMAAIPELCRAGAMAGGGDAAADARDATREVVDWLGWRAPADGMSAPISLADHPALRECASVSAEPLVASERRFSNAFAHTFSVFFEPEMPAPAPPPVEVEVDAAIASLSADVARLSASKYRLVGDNAHLVDEIDAQDREIRSQAQEIGSQAARIDSQTREIRSHVREICNQEAQIVSMMQEAETLRQQALDAGDDLVRLALVLGRDQQGDYEESESPSQKAESAAGGRHQQVSSGASNSTAQPSYIYGRPDYGYGRLDYGHDRPHHSHGHLDYSEGDSRIHGTE
ncbi:hypothetical protein FOA52_008580 [Chlamydomonas sp. UWO 241]|nr:hypothetical protein FOA52_008580 [Chlamydomonas sp. UWO 241]